MSKILILSNQLTNDLSKVSNPVLKTIYLKSKKNKFLNFDYYAVDVLLDSKYAYLKLILFLIFNKKLLMKYKYIHVHFGGITAFIASCFINPKKLIITFHGTDLHGGIKKNSLKSLLTRLASIFASHRAFKISLVSSSLKEYLPKYLLHKVQTIPTGVDLNFFYPCQRVESIQKLNLDKNKKYILFADISNSRVKRYDIARGTISLLKDMDSSFTLLKLSGISHELVPLYLNASSAILIVSDNEGSPSIVKEAIATHTPIFSINVGDVWSYMGSNDLKLPSQDPSQLANTIIKYNFRNEYCIDERIFKKIDITEIRNKYYMLYE